MGVVGSSAGSKPGSVLVLNAGSSSLKFAVVDAGSGRRSVSGLAERLGDPDARLTIRSTDDERDQALPGSDHTQAVHAVLEAMQHHPHSSTRLVGIGHRVVHGGARFAESVLIDDEVLAAIDECSRLAPLHNPPGLAGIRAAQAAAPDLPQVAVFDTAYHQTMPPAAYRYAVPERWYDEYAVRRYGFHGTSVRFVSRRTAELLGRPLDDLALVVAHLGNGCSATAVLHGRSVDTTMGMTPLEGLVMGTRSGDVDPAVVGYLVNEADLKVDEVTSALNHESGLLGLSGMSNDVRAVAQAAANGHEPAQLAIDVFVHRLAKAVAALVVPLGRLDALAFTGGIGEHSALIRARVVHALGFLGLSLDDQANDVHGSDTDGRVSQPAGPRVLVVPTDEEWMIAEDTARLIGM